MGSLAFCAPNRVALVVEHFGGARSAIGCLSTTNDACALYRVRHISEFSPLESIGVMCAASTSLALQWQSSSRMQPSLHLTGVCVEGCGLEEEH